MILGALTGFLVWFVLYCLAQFLSLTLNGEKIYPTLNAIPMAAGFAAIGALVGVNL